MIWYQKLGFYNNPFSIKPGALQSDMVAYDLDYLNEKIKNAELLFIEGMYGTGKTTLLKSIISNFRGKNKIIYFSFIDGKNFDIESLLDGANPFWRKITGFKVKNMILLLDEVQNMSKADAEEVLKYYQNGVLQSVVFVSHDYREVELPDELEAYLDDNVIRTVALSQEEAIELVRSRIGDIELFSNKILKRLFDLAGKNPRRFLEYCEDVARYAVDMEDYKVTDFHVESVFADALKEEKPKKEIKAAPEPKPKEEKIEIKEKIEIYEVKPEPKTESADDPLKRQKKFKVNRLMEGKKDPLGTIEAAQPEAEDNKDEPKVEIKEIEPVDLEKDEKEEKGKPKEKGSDEEIPEYKVFVFDN